MYKFYRYDKELKKSKETTLQTAFPFLMNEKCCVSFVGAGGKSSLIACIADWGTLHRKKVLVTTTTHIFRPSSEKLAQNEQELEQIWHTGNWAVIGTVDPVQPQKLQSPKPYWLQRAAELADLILIEADGSKRLPCKVPASHEPVILPQTDVVVAVLGLSALNRPLKDCCFRLEKATELLSVTESHPLTREHMATIFASGQGLRKAVNTREYVVVLNQCDNEERRNVGEQISGILCGMDSSISHIVLTKLHP